MDKSVFGVKDTHPLFVAPTAPNEKLLVNDRRWSRRRMTLDRRKEARLHLDTTDRREHAGRRDCDFLEVNLRKATH